MVETVVYHHLPLLTWLGALRRLMRELKRVARPCPAGDWGVFFQRRRRLQELIRDTDAFISEIVNGVMETSCDINTSVKMTSIIGMLTLARRDMVSVLSKLTVPEELRARYNTATHGLSRGA